jgi:hypothetical protein
MEDKLAEVVLQQYGTMALVIVGVLSLFMKLQLETQKLRREFAFQINRDLLGKRLEAYGLLWHAMKPIAIYGQGEFQPDDLRRLREALASWYFSAAGGLFLTERARTFYFGLQNLLANLSSTVWSCDRRPDNPRAIFVEILRHVGGDGTSRISADLDHPIKWAAEDWTETCEAVEVHLRSQIIHGTPAAGGEIFAAVQQISSALRTILVADVGSRSAVSLRGS